MSSRFPITFADVEAAMGRIRPYLPRTAFRRYPVLDEAVGGGTAVFVKHENHNPTNAFKVRNGLSALTALGPGERTRGVIAATRGNHGLGVAWAAVRLGIPVTVCVPVGNSPGKNAAIRGLGATLVEEGKDYDASVEVAKALAARHGLTLIHSTNNLPVVAGAATVTLEMVEEEPELDALVVSVGGGSQAVGALVVCAERSKGTRVYGVQAAGARAIHDSWHARRPLEGYTAHTIADGLATGKAYETTFGALVDGLAGFVAVEEAELAEAVRLLVSCTHNLPEPAGAAGLAGLMALGPTLAGKKVGVILSGGNCDPELLVRILRRGI
jgi:threonine dehydratase